MEKLKVGHQVKPDDLLSQIFGNVTGEVIKASPSPFSSNASVTVQWEYGGTIQASPNSFILTDTLKTEKQK